jgi:hypothetical protein
MTKNLLAIIPFLTACTIDIELSLDLGPTGELAEDPHDDVVLQGLLSTGFDDLDVSPREAEHSASCTASVVHLDVTPEVIVVEWEMTGEPHELTAVGLFVDRNADGLFDIDEELLQVEFYDVDTVDTSLELVTSESSRNEEDLRYLVYVASGDDISNPRCSTEEQVVVAVPEADAMDDEDSDIDLLSPMDGPLSSCSGINDVQSTYEIVDGESLTIFWDVEWFDADTLNIFFYAIPVSEDSSTDWLQQRTENDGQYQLPDERVDIASMVNEYQEVWGEYGFTIADAAAEGCVHYRIIIHPNF